MIAKAIKGRSFRGALEYDLSKEKGHVIDTNMGGETPRALAKEFGEIRKLRPKLGKAVLHVSLSAAPGERVTDEQWQQIAQHYLRRMGLENNQYLVTRHTDTEHPHVHLLVNRIRFDGGVTSDSHDYRRQEVLMRAIEREHDLQRVQPSAEVLRRAPTRGEIEEGLRIGQPSTRQRLQQLCDAAARDCHSFTQYAQLLEAVDVLLVPVTQLEGRKMSGLSYVLDGVMMKGSDLGKGYSPMGLAKRGVSYVKERDAEAAGRSLERSKAAIVEPPDRDAARSEVQERGRIGGGDRTTGPGDGRADGRNAGQPGAGRTAQQGADRAVADAGGRSRHAMDQRRDGSETGGAAAGDGRGEHGVQPLPAGDTGWPGHGAARERIVALAGTSTGDQQRAGRQGSGGAAQARDRTAEAAQRQMNAMGVDRFVITLRHAKLGKQEERRWDKECAMRGMAWLKRMNARGYDVLIRPDGDHGLVLLKGLSKLNLETLKKIGFGPAAVVDAGGGSYQAWVRLSEKPLAERLRGLAGSGLHKEIGLSVGLAAGLVEGGLAGFTNRSIRTDRDTHPYALLLESAGKRAMAASAYLDQLQAGRLKEKKIEVNRQHPRSRGPSR